MANQQQHRLCGPHSIINFVWRFFNPARQQQQGAQGENPEGGNQEGLAASTESNAIPLNFPIPDHIRRFTLEDMVQATSANQIIGSGATSVVYKGSFEGQNLAIKRMESRHQAGQFKGGGHVYIVYQYYENGSLADLLFTGANEDQVNPLTWKQRINIAIGISSGIKYLQTAVPLAIVHCDLKPANVLLDKDFNSVIADFGAALKLTEDTVTGDAGSIGYFHPVTLNAGEITIDYDIYAIGAILLDLVRGAFVLPRSVKEEISSEYIGSITDSKMGEFQDEDVREVLQLAKECLRASGERPTIEQILDVLGTVMSRA